MDRPKVLVISSTYPRYAGDNVPLFVHELCRRLSAWFEMRVLAPHAPGAATRERMDGVEIHRFRYLPERFETLAYGGGILPGLRRRPWRLGLLPPFLLGEYLAAARLLREPGYALVHAHWLIPHGWIAARLRAPQRPLLCTSHGSDLFALHGGLLRRLQRGVLRRADAVTTVSRALAARAAAVAETDLPVRVLPMGIDTRRFRPPVAGTSREGLLYVGRLVAGKGLDTLLTATAKLPRSRRQVSLTVIGAGPEAENLRKLVEQLELAAQVRFLGAVPNTELAPHYQRAAALVFPSLLGTRGEQEGMGLVPLEALACGCPVIASDLPAVREAVTEGETGFLVPPGDSDGLAAAIDRLLQDPVLAQRVAERGRRLVESRYDWDRVAAGYRDLYFQLIGKRPA